MKGMFAFLLGVGLGWLLRARSVRTDIPAQRLASRSMPMADAPVVVGISPLQAFLVAYQQANKAAWEGLGAIHTRLESGENPALEAQADALQEEIKAMAVIARDRATQLLASSGAIARLDGLAQALADRAAELPAATDAVKAAGSVVGATRSFVSFFG